MKMCALKGDELTHTNKSFIWHVCARGVCIHRLKAKQISMTLEIQIELCQSPKFRAWRISRTPSNLSILLVLKFLTSLSSGLLHPYIIYLCFAALA